jgi:hypothetical protein
MRVTAIGLLLAVQWLYGQNTAAQTVPGTFPAPAASASRSADRVLYFANTDSRQGMQEINNAIRAITSIPASLDLTQRTLEVGGTAKDIELAEWVFNELDRAAPAQSSRSPNSTTYTEQLPNGKTLTEIVRVFYFTNRGIGQSNGGCGKTGSAVGRSWLRSEQWPLASGVRRLEAIPSLAPDAPREHSSKHMPPCSDMILGCRKRYPCENFGPYY